MKRILAVMVASMVLMSSTICVFAADSASAGSSSGGSGTGGSSSYGKDLAEQLQKMQDKMDDLEEKLDAAIKAKQQVIYKDSGSSGRHDPQPPRSDAANAQLKRNNAVNSGGTTVAQGGHVVVNGGKSNVTFVLTPATGGNYNAAASWASRVNGTLLACVSTSSPGASFKSARVNFYVDGVIDNDTVAAYQLQGNTWFQLPTPEVRKDHVVVDMTKHGLIAFIRVPAVAQATV